MFPSIRLIKRYIQHRRYSRVLDGVIAEEGLLDKFKETAKLEFDRAWFGRLYSVYNPRTDDRWSYDVTGGRVDEYTFTRALLMEKMVSMEAVIKDMRLLDMVLFDIEMLDGDGNCLITLSPLTWADLSEAAAAWWKVYKIVLTVLAGAAVGCGIGALIWNLLM